jgi:hypothetical protein
MKSLALVLLLLVATPSFARTVTLSWTASTAADVAGYRVYQTTTSGVYTYGAATAVGSTVPGTTTFQVTGLPNTGPIYFVVTAYDTSGLESGPSNQIVGAVTPPAPVGLSVTGP